MYEKEIKAPDQNIQIEIGQRIQERRMMLGLTGADLSAYLNVSVNQISRIETGKVKCFEHIYVLAQLLECSADYLLYGKKTELDIKPEQLDGIRIMLKSFGVEW